MTNTISIVYNSRVSIQTSGYYEAQLTTRETLRPVFCSTVVLVCDRSSFQWTESAFDFEHWNNGIKDRRDMYFYMH
eukprot:scaffold10272_cov96-Cylindrotheca_fusiformis.AAC.1